MRPTEPAALPLFDAEPARPLADRLRPQRLEDVVGQDHLLAPDAPLGRHAGPAAPRLHHPLVPATRREDPHRPAPRVRQQPRLRTGVCHLHLRAAQAHARHRPGTWPCTGSPACSTAARPPCSWPAAWSASQARTSASPTRTRSSRPSPPGTSTSDWALPRASWRSPRTVRPPRHDGADYFPDDMDRETYHHPHHRRRLFALRRHLTPERHLTALSRQAATAREVGNA